MRGLLKRYAAMLFKVAQKSMFVGLDFESSLTAADQY